MVAEYASSGDMLVEEMEIRLCTKELKINNPIDLINDHLISGKILR